MTVPRLSGLWDEVGDSFMHFAKQLPGMIHPNADYLKDVRRQIALDPTMLQKLADAEKESPGFLNRMGLGGLAQQVNGMSESSELLGERKKREVLKSPLAEDEQTQFRSNVLGIKDPLTREQQRATLRSTNVNITATEANTELTRLQKSILDATKKGDIAKAQMAVNELGEYNRAKVIVDRLAAQKKGIFQAYLDKELAPEEVAAVRAVPSYARAWEGEFAVWKEKNDLEEGKKNRNLEYYRINQNGPEEEMNRQRAKLAMQIALFNGGNMDDVIAYQKLDPQRKIQLESAGDPSKIPPELQGAYRGMVSSKNFQQKMARKEVQTQLKSADPKLGPALKMAFSGKTTDERTMGVNAANAIFASTYAPLVESGLVKEVPQLGYDTKWTGGVREIFWTTTDPEAQDAVLQLGFKVSGKAQDKVNKATESVGKFDYAKAAELVNKRAGSDSTSVEQEILNLEARATAEGMEFDKVKLRTAIARARGKNK